MMRESDKKTETMVEMPMPSTRATRTTGQRFMRTRWVIVQCLRGHLAHCVTPLVRFQNTREDRGTLAHPGAAVDCMGPRRSPIAAPTSPGCSWRYRVDRSGRGAPVAASASPILTNSAAILRHERLLGGMTRCALGALLVLLVRAWSFILARCLCHIDILPLSYSLLM